MIKKLCENAPMMNHNLVFTLIRKKGTLFNEGFHI